jgi:hypothetical protein
VKLPMSEWGETTSYRFRIKARIDRTQYDRRQEHYPLSKDGGTKLDLSARAYILRRTILDKTRVSGWSGSCAEPSWDQES